MSSPIGRIRDDMPEEALKKKCKEGNAGVDKFRGFRGVVLKGEFIADRFCGGTASNQRCDCIFVYLYEGEIRIALIELKSGSWRADEVYNQLDNCRIVAENNRGRYFGKDEKVVIKAALCATGSKSVALKSLLNLCKTGRFEIARIRPRTCVNDLFR